MQYMQTWTNPFAASDDSRSRALDHPSSTLGEVFMLLQHTQRSLQDALCELGSTQDELASAQASLAAATFNTDPITQPQLWMQTSFEAPSSAPSSPPLSALMEAVQPQQPPHVLAALQAAQLRESSIKAQALQLINDNLELVSRLEALEGAQRAPQPVSQAPPLVPASVPQQRLGSGTGSSSSGSGGSGRDGGFAVQVSFAANAQGMPQPATTPTSALQGMMVGSPISLLEPDEEVTAHTLLPQLTPFSMRPQQPTAGTQPPLAPFATQQMQPDQTAVQPQQVTASSKPQQAWLEDATAIVQPAQPTVTSHGTQATQLSAMAGLSAVKATPAPPSLPTTTTTLASLTVINPPPPAQAPSASQLPLAIPMPGPAPLVASPPAGPAPAPSPPIPEPAPSLPPPQLAPVPAPPHASLGDTTAQPSPAPLSSPPVSPAVVVQRPRPSWAPDPSAPTEIKLAAVKSHLALLHKMVVEHRLQVPPLPPPPSTWTADYTSSTNQAAQLAPWPHFQGSTQPHSTATQPLGAPAQWSIPHASGTGSPSVLSPMSSPRGQQHQHQQRPTLNDTVLFGGRNTLEEEDEEGEEDGGEVSEEVTASTQLHLAPSFSMGAGSPGRYATAPRGPQAGPGSPGGRYAGEGDSSPDIRPHRRTATPPSSSCSSPHATRRRRAHHPTSSRSPREHSSSSRSPSPPPPPLPAGRRPPIPWPAPPDGLVKGGNEDGAPRPASLEGWADAPMGTPLLSASFKQLVGGAQGGQGEAAWGQGWAIQAHHSPPPLGLRTSLRLSGPGPRHSSASSVRIAQLESLESLGQGTAHLSSHGLSMSDSKRHAEARTVPGHDSSGSPAYPSSTRHLPPLEVVVSVPSALQVVGFCVSLAISTSWAHNMRRPADTGLQHTAELTDPFGTSVAQGRDAGRWRRRGGICCQLLGAVVFGGAAALAVHVLGSGGKVVRRWRRGRRGAEGVVCLQVPARGCSVA